MDIPLENTAYQAELGVRIRGIAQQMGKQVIEVETNIGHFLDVFAHWRIWYGALLRTAVMLLQGFRRFYIPGSYFGADLCADGTHPLLDPLWSTSRLGFVHDGCEMTRFRKTEFVSRHPITYDTLRVCWLNQPGLQNCCECEKCVRTMIHLQALDRLEQFSVFPKPLSLHRSPVSKLTTMAIRNLYQPAYYYLQDTGKHPELLAYLERLLFPPWRVRGYRRYRTWQKCTKRRVRDYARETWRGRHAAKPVSASPEATSDQP